MPNSDPEHLNAPGDLPVWQFLALVVLIGFELLLWKLVARALEHGRDPMPLAKFALATLAVTIAMGIVAGLTVSIRRKRRLNAAAAGRCPTCGDDLRASEGRCPECGVQIPPSDLG